MSFLGDAGADVASLQGEQEGVDENGGVKATVSDSPRSPPRSPVVSFSVKDPAENKRRLSSLFSLHATSSLFPSFHHTPQNDAMIGL